MGIPTSTRRTAAVFAAVAATVALSGCSVVPLAVPAPVAAPAAPVAPADPQAAGNPVTPGTLVMVIRHGEKPEDDATPGLDANGAADDHSLTAVGWDRARKLADLFDPVGAPPRPGLGTPTVIYAAGANEDGEGQRTRETVKPLADRLGVPVVATFGKGDEKQLVAQVTAGPGPVLIAWQHGEIPSIAEAFPGVTPTPPSEWPDDRFDVVWTFTKTGSGWRFAQLPELVLPQDRPGVITANS